MTVPGFGGYQSSFLSISIYYILCFVFCLCFCRARNLSLLFGAQNLTMLFVYCVLWGRLVLHKTFGSRYEHPPFPASSVVVVVCVSSPSSSPSWSSGSLVASAYRPCVSSSPSALRRCSLGLNLDTCCLELVLLLSSSSSRGCVVVVVNFSLFSAPSSSSSSFVVVVVVALPFPRYHR